jgi:hypothetical protein
MWAHNLAHNFVQNEQLKQILRGTDRGVGAPVLLTQTKADVHRQVDYVNTPANLNKSSNVNFPCLIGSVGSQIGLRRMEFSLLKISAIRTSAISVLPSGPRCLPLP